jgi:iron complex transport system permease protein
MTGDLFVFLGGGAGSTFSLILSGIVVGGQFASGVGLITYFADPATRLPQIVYWLLGSFVGTTYDKTAIIAAATLVGGTGLLALSWRINLLSLGEMDARAFGGAE